MKMGAEWIGRHEFCTCNPAVGMMRLEGLENWREYEQEQLHHITSDYTLMNVLHDAIEEFLSLKR